MSILAGEKFELKLLRASDILLHEESEDSRFERLVERFGQEKVLYNPLIVGRDDRQFILIDGANRFEALKRSGCKTILAQLVDYRSAEVKLRSWYHYVNEMGLDELKGFLLGFGIGFEKWDSPRGQVNFNSVGVVSSYGEGILIRFSNVLTEMLRALCLLNKYYESKYSYSRIDSDTDITDVGNLSPEEGLLFVYPDFGKEQILDIAGGTQKLPAGITRHLIPNRVLHIRILIEALKTDEHLDKRNEELEKFIQFKIDTQKVRLYREPILVFDE